ncbi:MAG: hypothetical protein ACAH83_12850 [Alphaproteobacteria bacterium]
MIPLRLEELDSYFYLGCMAVVGMSVISTYFIKGTPNQQVRGFVVCLLAGIVASPLIGAAVLYGGIYSGVAGAMIVMSLVVQGFNRWVDKKNPRRAEESEDDVHPKPAAAAPSSPQQIAREKFLKDVIPAFAIIYPVVAGHLALRFEPDGITIQDYVYAFLPPVITFWWFPIKTYGARILYIAPAAAAYAVLVSGFLIVVYGYDDCPVRRVVQDSPCIPKQWEASTTRYFHEHPDPSVALPSGGE